MKKIQLMLAILIPFLFLGCAGFSSSLMPSEESTITSIWKNYEAAENAFRLIEPQKTTLAGLRKIGFDPQSSPNVTILDSLTIRNLFLENNFSPEAKDLPPELRDYLKDFSICKGFKFQGKSLRTKGEGNYLLRISSFRKEDRTTGWNFEAWIFLKNDTVAFTLWKGDPNINQPYRKKNPLGPFSGITGILGNLPKIIIEKLVD